MPSPHAVPLPFPSALVRRLVASGALVLAALAWGGTPAHAACNAIPEKTSEVFRGAVGTVDVPFARGGDLDIVRTGRACGSPDLADHNGDGSIDGRDYEVLLAFVPPGGGAPNLVLVTSGDDCGNRVCAGSGKKPHCEPNVGIAVDTAARTVRFPFPDTDDHAPGGEGRPFTGPVRIAVTPAGADLPCGLESRRCADYGGSGGLFACVDELYRGSSCDEAPPPDPVFSHFTALPPANVFANLCHDAGNEAPGCTDSASELRFAVDAEGNALVPVRWTEILRDKPGAAGKDNRRVQGSTAVLARSGVDAPVDVPGEAFLASFTPLGTTFQPAPRFEPGLLGPNPASSRPRELKLSGEADEPESTLRVARRLLWGHQCDASGPSPGQACDPGAPGDCPGAASCDPRATPAYFACSGGARDGLPCARRGHCPQGSCNAGSQCTQAGSVVTPAKACLTDADCASGQECGRALFEFRDRLEQGVGPVVVPKQSPAGSGRVCRGGPDDGKPCTATCTCVGFRASAQGYSPK